MAAAKVRLREGEELIAQSKVHIAALILPIVTIIVGFVMQITLDPSADFWQFIALVLIVVGAWRTIDAIATRLTTWIVLTDERLIASTGPFKVKRLDVAIHHVDRVLVRRGPFARMFNYGTLLITARGMGNQRLQYRQIADPDNLARAIRKQMARPPKHIVTQENVARGSMG